MLNAKIEFKIKMYDGSHKGQIIYINIDVDDLEEYSISSELIRLGYLDNWCNNNEYIVIDRNITIFSE